MDTAAFASRISGFIDNATDWLSVNLGFFFDAISWLILSVERPLEFTLTSTPSWITIVVLAVLSFLVGGWRLASLVAVGLALILAFNLWVPAMFTLSLVLTAAVLALLLGIPLGILTAESRSVNAVVFFFGIGTVPGVVATIFFAMPLPVRLTAHGLRMVDHEFIEACEAFGANRLQTLFQVKLPLAFGTIMAGVNQCIMMSLSMVIIASMIGAGGLGDEIIRSISRLQVGTGMLAGISVVILAIVIDRFSKGMADRVDPSR